MSRPQPIQRSYLESEPLKLKQWTGSYDDKRKAAVEWAKLVDEQRVKKASVVDLKHNILHGEPTNKEQYDDVAAAEERLEGFTNVPGLLGKAWDTAKGITNFVSEAFQGEEDLSAQASKKNAFSAGGLVGNTGANVSASESVWETEGTSRKPDQIEADDAEQGKLSVQQTL